MAISHRSRCSNIVYWLDNKLYLNITNFCTNNCYFCIRKFKTGIAEFNLKLKEDPSSNDIKKGLQKVLDQKSWSEIVFCGFGEPTARLDVLLEIARWISRKSQLPIRVDTNGHALLLYPERDVVRELKDAGVTRVSVSLNAHNEALYNEVCQPKFANAFEKVLEFIEQARDACLEVEVTAVAVPEVNVSEVERVSSGLRVKFRVRPYRPCVW